MNATADLFAEPVEIVPDLRASASWNPIPHPTRPGENLPWVVESFCGRYTITWSVTPDTDARFFLVWRRHPLVNGRRPVASYIDRRMSAREARQLAATHAEANP